MAIKPKLSDVLTDGKIISTKEARKLLGKRVSDQLSDEKIEQIISSMSAMARQLLWN